MAKDKFKGMNAYERAEERLATTHRGVNTSAWKRENLFVSDHKTSNETYRKNFDRTFNRKPKICSECTKWSDILDKCTLKSDCTCLVKVYEEGKGLDS